MLYANGTADIVGPFDTKGKVQWENGASSGNYFMGGALKQVRDPQCGAVTTAQNLQTSCTLNAVANSNGQILLQNPLPGRRGTSGLRGLEGAGQWRFDANMSKSVKITETKTIQFRVDALNVLNHPEPSAVITSVNDANATARRKVRCPSISEIGAVRRNSPSPRR